MDAKEIVKGEITSDETINIYFLTKYGFRSFENDEQFSYEYGAESVLKKKIDFKPSKTATWYLVIENEGKNMNWKSLSLKAVPVISSIVIAVHFWILMIPPL